MPLNLDAPLMTRNGRQALLIGRVPDPYEGKPLAVAVQTRGIWTVETYELDGRYLSGPIANKPSSWDLVNRKPAATVHHIRQAVRAST
jgi:hypothetical protein